MNSKAQRTAQFQVKTFNIQKALAKKPTSSHSQFMERNCCLPIKKAVLCSRKKVLPGDTPHIKYQSYLSVSNSVFIFHANSEYTEYLLRK